MEQPVTVPLRDVPSADGIDLAVWAHGEGTPLITTPPGPWIDLDQTARVVHAIGAQRYPWHLPGYQVLRYDQRGAGRSTGAANYRLDGQVDDLQTVVHSLTTGPVVLIGYCHSGPAAIAYAHANPDRVALLILWCTYAHAERDYFGAERVQALGQMMQSDWNLFGDAWAREVLGWDFPAAAQMTEVFRQGRVTADDLALAWRELAETNVSDPLPSLRVPAIVCHRRDCVAPSLEVGQRLARSIPGAELAVFPGSASLAFPEHPELIQRVLLAAADHATGGAPHPGPLQQLIDDGFAASALTPRATETLALVAAGLSNLEIADRLVVSRATVKKDLADSFERLGVQNRTQAVTRAREIRLLP